MSASFVSLFESSVTLYHGTNSEWVSSIKIHGLKNPCLSDKFELAYYYAEAADGGGEPVVLSCLVDTTLLRVDRPSLSEPVGYGSTTSKELEDRVEEMFAKLTENHPEWVVDGYLSIPSSYYQASLSSVGTVLYDGVIEPRNITFAAKA